MKAAKLPEHLEETLIEDMHDGDVGYTQPWAMYADREGALFLVGDYPIEKTSARTARLKVTRLAGRYHVDVSLCPERRWRKGAGTYVGGHFKSIPVFDLTGLANEPK